MNRKTKPIGALVGISLLTGALSCEAQGTIRYVNHFDQGFGQADRGYDWDVDGNGTTDFGLFGGGAQFAIYPLEGNSVLALPIRPPDFGSNVVPLGPRSEIGDFDYSPLQWVTTTYYDQSPIGVSFNTCYDTGCNGLFVNVKAYFGLQFLADGEAHFGWAFMENGVGTGGLIYDYAYETVAGKPAEALPAWPRGVRWPEDASASEPEIVLARGLQP